jgi:hypothetical protein
MSNYPKDVYFICPECKHTELQEVMPVTRFHIVERVSKIGDNYGVSYDGDEPFYGGSPYPTAYRCKHCHHVIANSSDDLYDWLEKHGMLKEWEHLGGNKEN